jgi:uncharacterized protein YjbI with pentapeptide repeats
MANPEHLAILRQGVKVWNQWRREHSEIKNIDLSNADLHGIDLFEPSIMAGANLQDVNLQQANLHKANLFWSDLHGACLIGAKLGIVNLGMANLTRANLNLADLTGADLTHAKLNEASLKMVSLRRATLVETDLSNANLSGCQIYGASVWKVKLDGTTQSDLIITDTSYPEPIITVDNLEIAQFIYLLLNNEKLRDVISTIGQKAVLILGRFTPERKAVLDALREALRQRGYIPILFDFDKPTERDFTETIKLLAGMSLFVIADITNPKSSPLELQATVPDYMIPFAPIIQKDEAPFSMFKDLQKKYAWVLDVRAYENKEQLIEHLDEGIIKPALKKHNELIERKNEALKIRGIDEL